MSNKMEIILGTMTFSGQTSREETIRQLCYFVKNGYVSLDTARMYCHGGTEELLGELLDLFRSDGSYGIDVEKLKIASKVNPFPAYNKSLSFDSVMQQSDEILSALRVNHTDIFYLHAPDVHNPIEETLFAVQELYMQGKFRRFGLSNYAAWEVVYIYHYCALQNFILPTVYQGMYNAITRDVERELFPALRKLNIKFFAYNPLCGGLLTGKHSADDLEATIGTRFDTSNEMYRNRYWNDQYFAAIDIIREAARSANLSMAECSIRWLRHHSQLTENDGIIVGASSCAHLEANLAACEGGALPENVVEAFEQAWLMTRAVCPKYFRP